MANDPNKPDFSDVRGGVISSGAVKPSPSDFDDVPPGSPVDETSIYKVAAGDSLSKIAKQFYGDANAWPRIFDANRDLLKNPDLIQPGQMLKIPPRA